MGCATSVRHFMEVAGQKLPKTPTIPSLETIQTRMRLSDEEYMELQEAIYDHEDELTNELLDDLFHCFKHLRQHGKIKPDLVEVCDALADSTYVAYGTAMAFGVDLDKVLEEVCHSNASKLINCRVVNSKVVKGPSYIPPNIKGVLCEQGWAP